jgi:hypothetical protein
MITRSPSQFDGKPVNTPTDIVPAWKAGVTFGPDQVERDAEVRRLRNRASKAQSKARHKGNVAAQSREEFLQRKAEHKRRWKRADNITRGLRRGTTTRALAAYWGITPDDVLAEAKWLSETRNRVRVRHGSLKDEIYP